MPEDFMLQEAIEAVRQRKLNRARDLLTRLLKVDKQNPLYWLWMSTVVETSKERLYCLQMVLRLDPDNMEARRGLMMIGVAPEQEQRKPAPLAPRKWQVRLITDPSKGGLRILWANPILRVSLLAVLGLAVMAGVIIGIVGTGRRPVQVAARPTRTPAPLASYTPTPTYIGYIAPVTPATVALPSSGPPPLWTRLEATYTPTPVYVSTPHVISGEAYRAGEIAYANGDWQVALDFFNQAASLEPEAPDIPYHIGEIHRVQGNNRAALSAYNKAISIDRAFAPAYLGKARARLALDPKADILDDLTRAIEYDPNLAEAYLERLSFSLAKGDVESSLVDLEAVEQLMPLSPWPHFYRAQIAMEEGDVTQALESAGKAYELDQTVLPIYKVYGEAAALGGEFDAAVSKLEVYLEYEQKDAAAWFALGKAYSQLASEEQISQFLMLGEAEGDFEKALSAYERMGKSNGQYPGLSLQRGCAYLAVGEGQKAVNELLVARQEEAAQYTGSEQSPLWFAMNMGLGRALLVADRYQDAYKVIDGARNQAKTELEKAAYYYWRATVLEAMDNHSAAARDWKALSGLQDDAIPRDWLEQAETRLATPTSSPNPTSTPMKTTATITATPVASPNKSATPQP